VAQSTTGRGRSTTACDKEAAERRRDTAGERRPGMGAAPVRRRA